MSRPHFKVQAWNQPAGRGNGWAPCTDKKAETFFVFEDGSRIPLTFITRAEAQAYIEKMKKSRMRHHT